MPPSLVAAIHPKSEWEAQAGGARSGGWRNRDAVRRLEGALSGRRKALDLIPLDAFATLTEIAGALTPPFDARVR